MDAAQYYSINNYYLYSVSHPDKCGCPVINLSEDEEAQIESAGLTPAQIVRERVIRKVFTKYEIPIDICERVRQAFKLKLWRMGTLLSKLGGTKRKQQLLKWQDKDSVWNLQVNALATLVRQKRHAEEELKKEVTKRRKVQSTMRELKSKATSLKKLAITQAKTIVDLKAGHSVGGRGDSSKSWSEYSRQYRHMKKKALGRSVQAALSGIRGGCYEPVAVEFNNTENNTREVFDVLEGSFSEVVATESTEQDDKVKLALYIKDKFWLSDEAYHELSLLSKDVPRLYKLKMASKELNSSFDIHPAPEGVAGVQQSLLSRLMARVQNMQFAQDEIIQVKLSGDGTSIGRNIHVINVTFTLLNEGSLAHSVAGNHTIAILQVPENYDGLSAALSDIAKEASEIDTITIDGKTHQVEFFLGGDMKFLALACGIDSATANHSCVWCKCHRSDRWDMSKEWSAFDPSKGARTIEEIEAFAAKPKSRQKFNCSHKPLFPFIPIDHVVIDSLHLFLRGSDLLINLFINELRRQDGIEKATTVDRSKLNNLSIYENCLNDTCKIRFQWMISKESKKLQWRDLTGPEKVRLFKTFNHPEVFPNVPNIHQIHQVWMEFWRLINVMKEDCDPDQLQVDIKAWVREFLKLYQTKDVTPYIHSFAHHVPEFVKHYGNLTKFTQEGLEKLNDITTKHFQRSTSHDSSALKQALEKQNRIEDLETSGYSRSKRVSKCGVCGQEGHNRRSCLRRAPLQSMQSSCTD